MAMESATPFTYQSPAAAAAATTTYFPVPFHLQYAYQQQHQIAPAATVALPTVAVPPSVPAAPVYPAAYPYPQYQQAQQLFQKDAQIITPEALASVKAAIASSLSEQKVETKKKAIPRKAAGQTWEDPTLADWPESGSRI